MTPVRAACIDIGSNTTRLLVADVEGGRVVEIAQARAFTRIGAGLALHGELSDAKLAEVTEVVSEQVECARAAGAVALRVVGTAAIRRAGNGGELCTAIRTRVGVEVEVLDGAEEAHLAFRGATWDLDACESGEVAVVDVGGGSSEVAVGVVGGVVRWWRSLVVGSGVLADAHLRADPPPAAALTAMRADADAAFAGLDAPRVQRAVAVGGSATSLRRLVGPVLTPEALADALAVLGESPSDAVAERHGLDPIRVRLLPAGIVILQAVCVALAQPLTVGCGGLREGVCLELAALPGDAADAPLPAA